MNEKKIRRGKKRTNKLADKDKTHDVNMSYTKAGFYEN